MTSPNPAAQQRLKTILIRDNLRRTIRGVGGVVALFLGCAVCIFGMMYISRGTLWPQDYLDVAGTPSHTGIGIVTRLQPGGYTPYTPDEGTDYPPTYFPPKARIRIAGRETDIAFERAVQIGERIRVTYRVGKSGILYVSHADPVGQE